MAGRPSELTYVETPLLEQLKKLGWTVIQLDDSESTIRRRASGSLSPRL